jgi:lipid II:glycine glycyltransferase (peptidoglycan interpeptide bridge formation enzyme)
VQKGGVKPAQYRWLLDAEGRQRDKRGYRGMPLEMTEHWQAAKADAAGGDRGAGLAVFRADLGRDAAAGMLFLIHGRRATYHVGWTSEEGRNNAAHNLILWTAMKELKAKGIDLLDLGGVNTQSGAGIARFKIETGGRVLGRAGVYV